MENSTQKLDAPMTKKEALTLCRTRTHESFNATEMTILTEIVKCFYKRGTTAVDLILDGTIRFIPQTRLMHSSRSLRTVQRAIDALVEAGLVKIHIQDGFKNNGYTVHLQPMRTWAKHADVVKQQKQERREANAMYMKKRREEVDAKVREYSDWIKQSYMKDIMSTINLALVQTQQAFASVGA